MGFRTSCPAGRINRKSKLTRTDYDLEIIGDKAIVDGKEIDIKLNEDEDEITNGERHFSVVI